MVVSDNTLREGESPLVRASSACQRGTVPLGRGELLVTDQRILWFSRADILNFPFNLWKAQIVIEPTQVTRLRPRPLLLALNVITNDGEIFMFQIERGTLFNPLFVWRSYNQAKEVERAARKLVEAHQSQHAQWN